MISIKQRLFTNWHFMRWFRLVISLIIMYQAYQTHEYMIGLIGVFFLFQAVSGIGCCSSANSCAPIPKSIDSSYKEVEFEEIKTKK